jgi:hypothetical protein
VRDHSGQALAYVYFEDEPGRRSAAKSLTRDEGSNMICDLWATLTKILPFPERDVLTVFGLGPTMFA